MDHCRGGVLGQSSRVLPCGGVRPLVIANGARCSPRSRQTLKSLPLIHRARRQGWNTLCRAQDGDSPAVETEPPAAAVDGNKPRDTFVEACSLEALPKGSRKEVVVDGKTILLFWYRNELRACEARSPAEGAYSVGFMDALFTEDYGIVCPTTSTVFSIKTGEILDWLPNNPVLKALIPTDTCRPLEIYPVQIVGDTVYVSFVEGSQGGVQSMANKGGVGTSLEDNNVFYLEPKMYIEGQGPNDLSGPEVKKDAKLNPVTVIVGTLAVAIVGVAGTALAVYNESVPGLIGFWLVGFGVAALVVNRYTNIFSGDEDGAADKAE